MFAKANVAKCLRKDRKALPFKTNKQKIFHIIDGPKGNWAHKITHLPELEAENLLPITLREI